jgi:hypothetical protein
MMNAGLLPEIITVKEEWCGLNHHLIIQQRKPFFVNIKMQKTLGDFIHRIDRRFRIRDRWHRYVPFIQPMLHFFWYWCV